MTPNSLRETMKAGRLDTDSDLSPPGRRDDRVVIEVGPSTSWIAHLTVRLQIGLHGANPTHQGWRWRSVKKKTDRVDAVKLAQLSAVNQLPLVEVWSKEVGEWRSLIHYRQALGARRTAIKNTIRFIWGIRGGRTFPPVRSCSPSGWQGALHAKKLAGRQHARNTRQCHSILTPFSFASGRARPTPTASAGGRCRGWGGRPFRFR